MKRKVSLIGPATLMVSLPSKWAKEFGVKKGDELELTPQGRNLLIETKSLKKSDMLKISLNGLNANLIRYTIYSSYRKGYDEIRLDFDEEYVFDENSKKKVLVLDVINSVVDNIIGMEIVLQKQNYVLLKEISTVNHEEFLNTLKRIFITLFNTSSDMKDCIETKNKEVLERIKKLSDKKINRLCNFCSRIINKGGIVEIDKVPHYYSIISSLEEIGDSVEEICEIGLKDMHIEEEVNRLYGLLELLYLLFSDFNNEKLSKFYELKNKLKKKKCEGRLKVEMSKIAASCSKIIPEIISLKI